MLFTHAESCAEMLRKFRPCHRHPDNFTRFIRTEFLRDCGIDPDLQFFLSQHCSRMAHGGDLRIYRHAVHHFQERKNKSRILPDNIRRLIQIEVRIVDHMQEP